jgi:hypothetical protein
MVNDIGNQQKTVKRLEPHQAYETLGVLLASDSNLQEQYTKMVKAATCWADAMRTGSILKSDVWTAIQSTIW